MSVRRRIADAKSPMHSSVAINISIQQLFLSKCFQKAFQNLQKILKMFYFEISKNFFKSILKI